MYTVQAKSVSKKNAAVGIKSASVEFSITPDTMDELASPAELYLGAFAACLLKNVERFSDFMKFQYESATVSVKAERLDKPPRMDNISYSLKVYSNDPKLNSDLLKRNVERFGTIFNTVRLSCHIEGSIEQVKY